MHRVVARLSPQELERIYNAFTKVVQQRRFSVEKGFVNFEEFTEIMKYFPLRSLFDAILLAAGRRLETTSSSAHSSTGSMSTARGW